MCWEFSKFVQIKIFDCVYFGMAQGLIARSTVLFRVCCFHKGEAQFVYVSTVDKTISL